MRERLRGLSVRSNISSLKENLITKLFCVLLGVCDPLSAYLCVCLSLAVTVVGSGGLPRLSFACGRPFKSWVGFASHELQ